MAGAKRPSARLTLTVVGGLVLGLLIMDAVRDDNEQREQRRAESSTSTPRRTTSPPPSLTSDELLDATYMAQLHQRGVPIDDRDQLILVAHTVCVYLSQDGTTLIDAAAGIMDEYGYTGDQSGDIAVSAIDVYCPERSPSS